MSQSTGIEWTEATWNPVTGCDRVSPGCAHCYALDLAARLKRMGNPRYQHDGGRTSGPGFAVTLHPDKLEQPLHWRRPRRIFVNSMSDLFHEAVPDKYIAQVFNAMETAGHHTYQVLTKRPERMRDLLDSGQWRKSTGISDWPMPNVWLGTSIENRRFVDRAEALRETWAAVRFISAEPLLGPLIPDAPDLDGLWSDNYAGPGLDLGGIDWLIVGGESGPHHRPIDPRWVRDLRDACIHDYGFEDGQLQRTAFFFKQWGGRTPKAGGRELDGRTWDEFPQTAEVPT